MGNVLKMIFLPLKQVSMKMKRTQSLCQTQHHVLVQHSSMMDMVQISHRTSYHSHLDIQRHHQHKVQLQIFRMAIICISNHRLPVQSINIMHMLLPNKLATEHYSIRKIVIWPLSIVQVHHFNQLRFCMHRL